ncbi:MAG TPA: hypothetical protein VGH10_00315 [Actinomycetota bacterium]|jgi:hypothetical protein
MSGSRRPDAFGRRRLFTHVSERLTAAFAVAVGAARAAPPPHGAEPPGTPDIIPSCQGVWCSVSSCGGCACGGNLYHCTGCGENFHACYEDRDCQDFCLTPIC